MSQPSDGDLLEAFRRGDASAFTELVRTHQSALLRHARALLGPGGGHEDAVQEAFCKLAQSPPVLEARGDPAGERAQLAAWLHRVTRNGCMDLHRSESRRRRREESAALELFAATGGASDGGLDGVEAGDLRAAVERALTRLPVDQREVLVLRLLAEKSYREIADITGRKSGTVGWLLSVGMRALARELAGWLGEGRGGGADEVVARMARGEA